MILFCASFFLVSSIFVFACRFLLREDRERKNTILPALPPPPLFLFFTDLLEQTNRGINNGLRLQATCLCKIPL
jgi:hypothetical protein